jgi:hypothetical protein
MKKSYALWIVSTAVGLNILSRMQIFENRREKNLGMSWASFYRDSWVEIINFLLLVKCIILFLIRPVRFCYISSSLSVAAYELSLLNPRNVYTFRRYHFSLSKYQQHFKENQLPWLQIWNYVETKFVTYITFELLEFLLSI